MSTFKDLCERVDKTPQELRKIIKGGYKIEITPSLDADDEIWCNHWRKIENGFWCVKLYSDSPSIEPTWKTILPRNVPNYCGDCGAKNPKNDCQCKNKTPGSWISISFPPGRFNKAVCAHCGEKFQPKKHQPKMVFPE